MIVSFCRLARSRQSWICLLLLAFAALVVVAWSQRTDRLPSAFFEQILMGVFVSFLLPIFCLCFGTAGIASDREEETLVYILVAPIPRPLIYLSKLGAALAIVLCWTLGSLALLCLLAGPVGRAMWWQANFPVFLGALAYGSLFHLFGVIWRRAALVGLAYTFFFEVLMSNVPGIAQRLAIVYYLRRLMSFPLESDGGPVATLAANASSTALEAVSVDAARGMMYGVIVSLVLGGMVLFSRREY